MQLRQQSQFGLVAGAYAVTSEVWDLLKHCHDCSACLSFYTPTSSLICSALKNNSPVRFRCAVTSGFIGSKAQMQCWCLCSWLCTCTSALWSLLEWNQIVHWINQGIPVVWELQTRWIQSPLRNSQIYLFWLIHLVLLGFFGRAQTKQKIHC